MTLAGTSVPGLSIVIPAWNEEDRLTRTLDRYLPALAAHGLPFEVIVVSDGHRDATAEVAKGYSSSGVRVLEYSRKLGKGGAVFEGIKAARFDCVGYLDADGPIPPSEFLGLSLSLAEVDGVVASRWVRGSRVLRREPLLNIIAGRLWNFLVRSILFLPLRDTQCGAKLFRRSIVVPLLSAVALTNRAFDVALLYHIRKSGHQLKEVPVTWQHDVNTRMPIGRAIPVMFVSLLGIRVMNLPIAKRIPGEWVERFLERFGRT